MNVREQEQIGRGRRKKTRGRAWRNTEDLRLGLN